MQPCLGSRLRSSWLVSRRAFMGKPIGELPPNIVLKVRAPVDWLHPVPPMKTGAAAHKIVLDTFFVLICWLLFCRPKNWFVSKTMAPTPPSLTRAVSTIVALEFRFDSFPQKFGAGKFLTGLRVFTMGGNTRFWRKPALDCSANKGLLA